jgi:hypothetical protein
MDLRGLLMVGEFVSVEAGRYGAQHPSKPNEVVPGMYRINLGIGAGWDGTPLTRTVTYFAVDMETGEKTRFAQALEALDLAEGELIAVAVKPLPPRPGSTFINLDPVRVERVSASVATSSKRREPLRAAN